MDNSEDNKPRSIFPRNFSYDGKTVSFSKLQDCNWKAEIRIREYNSIMTIYGIQREPFRVKPQIGKRAVHLLKSNLQKCVRRKDDDRAIRTAMAIYSFSPSEVLRRLPIIMIEDCLPYPAAFIRLVWWMCAVSKGYSMCEEEVSDMLGIIVTMCESREYECFSLQSDSYIDHNLVAWKDYKESSFFWALELRKLYGGMGCDENMLGYHQRIWLERFKTDNWIKRLIQDDYLVDIDSVDLLDKDDILPEAIDYHPFLVKKLGVKFPDVGEEEIRQAIWMCRSRINMRKPLDPARFNMPGVNVKKVYGRIDKELTSFSLWLRMKINLKE